MASQSAATAAFAAVALFIGLTNSAFSATRDVVLPAELRARDVRWISKDLIYLAGGKKGVVSVSIAGSRATPVSVVRGEGALDGFFLSNRLAFNGKDILLAAPFGAVAWSKQPFGRVSGSVAFDVITDIDARADRVAVFGARRDEKGQWAPDGSVAWIGSLKANLSDLRPIYRTARGAPAYNQCEALEMGALRFLSNGDLAFLPGFEPGLQIVSPDGRVRRSIDTGGLGYTDSCLVTEDEWLSLAKDPRARYSWLNRHKTVDDIVELQDGKIGLVVREPAANAIRWSLLELHPDGTHKRTILPVIGRTKMARLKVDRRGEQLACLVLEHQLEGALVPRRVTFVALP